MLESILPNLVLGIAANRLDRHGVQAALDTIRGDPTIDGAFRDAWRSAAEELFGAYLVTAEYGQLPLDEQTFVKARLEWLKEDETFDSVFHAPSEADVSVPSRYRW
jgi:hypothetical protein